MRLTYTKAHNPAKLGDEIVAALPSLQVTAPDGKLSSLFTLLSKGTAISIEVPDTLSAANQTLLDTTVANHVAGASAAETQVTADNALMSNMVTTYQNMVAALDAMQVDFEAIKARADKLATLTTWDGLTLAQTTARLQQVMPALGQDLSTLAADTKELSTGAERMLKALRAVLRRTGTAL